MVRDFRAPKVIGLYLITGGGKGCELERTHIIPLIRELSAITKATLMIKYVDWSSDTLFKHTRETLPKDFLQNLEDQSERTFAGSQAPTWTKDGVDRHSSDLSGRDTCEIGKLVSTAQLMVLAEASNKTRDQQRRDMLAAGHLKPAKPPPLVVGDDLVFLKALSQESSTLMTEDQKSVRIPTFKGQNVDCANVRVGAKGQVVGQVVELDDGRIVLVKPQSAVHAAYAIKTSIDLKGFVFEGKVASVSWYNWWVYVGDG